MGTVIFGMIFILLILAGIGYYYQHREKIIEKIFFRGADIRELERTRIINRAIQEQDIIILRATLEKEHLQEKLKLRSNGQEHNRGMALNSGESGGANGNVRTSETGNKKIKLSRAGTSIENGAAI